MSRLNFQRLQAIKLAAWVLLQCWMTPLGATELEQKMKWRFQNIEVKALLQSLAEVGNQNLIVADGVSGPVSLHLNDMTWREALAVVVQSKNLVATQQAGVLWIAPKKEVPENLQALAIPLKYAKALDVVQRLQLTGNGAANSGRHWLSARGTVMAEPRTNQLFFLDTPVYLKQIHEVIRRLDVPIRQVMIEARIVEAEEQFGKSLGVRLGGAFAAPFTAPFAANAKPLNMAISGQALGSAGGVQPGFALNLPAGSAGQTIYPPPSFAISLFNAAANQFLNLEISALEADGKGKVVASPRVVTANQTKALIEQGTELPYQISAGNNITSIAFRKANLKLEVTPQITPDGSVVLDVDVNRDSVGQITAAGYAINTKHVKTQVRVEDGGTVVLGGIYEETDRNDDAKVPGLSEVPVLGWLFKKRDQTRRKSELLIFITPRVMSDSPN